jgi:RNA polymerase sigma factor (sigma-70 family)
MLLEQPGIYDQVNRVVHGITNDPNQVEDLVQEARLQLWLSKRQGPQQTLSWYLQACRFAVLEYLHRGRSVDSPKHHGSSCQMDSDLDDCPAPGSDVLEEVCARDDFSQLAGRLSPRERAVLCLLVESLGERQCGLELAISQQAVSKIRRQICRQATRLGLTP